MATRLSKSERAANISKTDELQPLNVGDKRRGSLDTVLTDVKCCRRQHQVLETCIRQSLQFWGPVDELPLSYWIDGTWSLWEPSSPMQVTPELKRVLTHAKILSEDCCRELPPLKAALRHAERSEAFAETLKEFQWCMSICSYAGVIRHTEIIHGKPNFGTMSRLC